MLLAPSQMPFLVRILGAGGELVLRLPGDSIQLWELKNLVLANAPRLIALTEFDLYRTDAAGDCKLTAFEDVKPPNGESVVTLSVKRTECAWRICVVPSSASLGSARGELW